MSCLNPKTIVNRSKILYKNLLQPYLLNVPCGQCSSCINSKNLQWRMRIYYEIISTFQKNGFCLFDTLTYSEDTVPWFSSVSDSYLDYPFSGPDFRCFNYLDVTLFLKRFRKRVSYSFPSSKVRYFYCGEYGQADSGTHRPHYHFLFFFEGISQTYNNYMCLSDLVSSCWSLGITDSYRDELRFPSFSDWVSHSILTSSSSDCSSLLKTSEYLSKYVTKQLAFDKVATVNLSNVYQFLMSQNSLTSGQAHSLYLKFKHLICPQFRSSREFGLSAIRDVDLEYVFRSNSLPFFDKHNVKINVPLGVYFTRKLFYYVHVNDDGSRSWRLNEDGLKRLWFQLTTRFNKSLSRFRSLLSSSDVHRNFFERVLDGRPLDLYVYYSVCFRGRIRDFDSFSDFNSLHPVEFVNQLDYIRASFPVPNGYFINSIVNFNSDNFVCDSSSGEVYSVSDFIRFHVFSSKYIPEFSGFDLIDNYMSKISQFESFVASSVDDEVSDIISRLNLIK